MVVALRTRARHAPASQVLGELLALARRIEDPWLAALASELGARQVMGYMKKIKQKGKSSAVKSAMIYGKKQIYFTIRHYTQ